MSGVVLDDCDKSTVYYTMAVMIGIITIAAFGTIFIKGIF